MFPLIGLFVVIVLGALLGVAICHHEEMDLTRGAITGAVSTASIVVLALALMMGTTSIGHANSLVDEAQSIGSLNQ